MDNSKFLYIASARSWIIERLSVSILLFLCYQTGEKKHREAILRAEFAKAIRFINRGVRKENRLKAIHFDLSKHYKRYCIYAPIKQKFMAWVVIESYILEF